MCFIYYFICILCKLVYVRVLYEKINCEKKETKSNGVYSVNKTCPAHITVFVQNKNTKNKTERAHHMVIILRAFSNSCYPIIL